jgi:hypothetical protein
MGLFNEYYEDAFNGEEALDDHDLDDEPEPLDPESWMDWNSEHLLNMWMSLRQYREDNYVNNTMMNLATFNDFCHFVMRFSS